ncbi:DUF2079 domain-containing protein [Kitasatospora sp. NPDC006697]|uniref:DUF2079 domain-containing protein n=1 Tax=Kitasatospora sp. NPDC006697 TaxID=3364020 RepID=UPI0036BCEFA4
MATSATMAIRPRTRAAEGAEGGAARRTAGPPLRDRLLPWCLAAVLFAGYGGFSVRRHQLLRTSGYDLGIFEQAVRGYAHGGAPVAALKGYGFNLMGDHFSPVLAVLAPVYRLFPSAVTLLLAQAALLAVAVVPLSRWAREQLGSRAALVVGAGYGGSWGIASTLGFDFHEVAFAVPLVAFSVVALGERRWLAAVLWAAPLVLVKEDLGITVAVIGGYAWWRGERRLGPAAVAFGVLASALEVGVLLPVFSPSHSYAYWDSAAGGSAHHGWGRLLAIPGELVLPLEKEHLLLYLLLPTALLAVRSPLALIGVPTLLWRLLSSNPLYWDTRYHYSAVLMPIAFAAFVDALVRLRERPARWWPRPRWFLAASLAVTLVLIPVFPFSQLGGAGFWTTPPHVRAVRSVLRAIPSGARVAATNQLVPQLTNRCTVVEFGWPEGWWTVDWIVVDQQRPKSWPISGAEQQKELSDARAAGFRTVRDDQGVLLLHRP